MILNGNKIDLREPDFSWVVFMEEQGYPLHELLSRMQDKPYNFFVSYLAWCLNIDRKNVIAMINVDIMKNDVGITGLDFNEITQVILKSDFFKSLVAPKQSLAETLPQDHKKSQ